MTHCITKVRTFFANCTLSHFNNTSLPVLGNLPTTEIIVSDKKIFCNTFFKNFLQNSDRKSVV